MQTVLFTHQGRELVAVFRELWIRPRGPQGESDIHSNTIRPTIDREGRPVMNTNVLGGKKLLKLTKKKNASFNGSKILVFF